MTNKTAIDPMTDLLYNTWCCSYIMAQDLFHNQNNSSTKACFVTRNNILSRGGGNNLFHWLKFSRVKTQKQAQIGTRVVFTAVKQ